MLTKSLHTVTSTVRVGRYLIATRKPGFWNVTEHTTQRSVVAAACHVAEDALSVLGYEVSVSAETVAADVTLRRIVRDLYATLAGEAEPLATQAVAAYIEGAA